MGTCLCPALHYVTYSRKQDFLPHSFSTISPFPSFFFFFSANTSWGNSLNSPGYFSFLVPEGLGLSFPSVFLHLGEKCWHRTGHFLAGGKNYLTQLTCISGKARVHRTSQNANAFQKNRLRQCSRSLLTPSGSQRFFPHKVIRYKRTFSSSWLL